MRRRKSPIQFLVNDITLRLKDKKKLVRFVASIFDLEKTELDSLLYVFSNDKLLQKLNKQFLDHNYKTDILTFPLSDNPVQAEVYISIPTVVQNAALYGTSFQEELERVIFHGALHLCGYDDKSKRQQQTMRKKEDHYLKLYKSFT